MTNRPLTPADPADLEQAVHYALCFGLTGKPHGSRLRDDPKGMAKAVVRHLARANYFVFQGPPIPPSDTGRWWGDNPGHNQD